MRDPNTLDQRLRTAFSGLDTRPGFNARLMDRLERVVREDARQAAQLARREEERRYRAAMRQHQGWEPWRATLDRISRWVTLERVGIAALAIGWVATWSPSQLSYLRDLTPEIVTALGLLAAVSPFARDALASLRARYGN